MKLTIAFAAAFILALGLSPRLVASGSNGSDRDCQQVDGKILWTVIPAPFDPHGRVLGTISGDLNGSTTDIVDSITLGPTIKTVDSPIFMTGKNDLLFGEAHAEFTPIPGTPNVADSQVITITGGTGKWLGATGSISAEGTGFNFFPPSPGTTYFKLHYKGEVCVPEN